MDLYVGVNSLNYTIGFATDAKVVYGNTNSVKYFAATVNGVSYKFYNSAVYMSGSTTYLLVLTEETGYCTYKANGSSGGGFAITSQGNGVYTSEYGIVGYDNIIRNSAEGTTKIMSANIPIFYDYSAYLNYITNPVEEPILLGHSAGGGGLYGGYRADTARGGGAGSGYIGNEFISNKKMVGFNVPTSSTASTKTESVQTCNISPYADTPKVGNGFATIKFLGTPAGTYTLDSVIKTRDMTHYQATAGNDINTLSNYFGTNYVLITNSTSIGDLEYSSIQGGYFRLPMESNTMIYVPISKLENVINARFGGITELYSGEFYVGVAKIVKNKMVIIDHSQLGCRWTGYSYRDFTLDHDAIDYIVFSGGYAFGYHCVSSFIEFTKEN